MLKLIGSAVLIGVISLMSTASANATTGPAMYMQDGTPGVGSNTSAVSGNATNYGSHTFSLGGAIVTCPEDRFTITSVVTTSVTIDPDLTNCSLLVSGTPVAAVTVDIPCDWNVSGGIFDTTTANVTGASLTTNCVMTFTAEAVGCTVHVAAQTRTGVSSNNINQAGSHDTSATPWGIRFTFSVSSMTYTTTGSCPGIPEHGTGTLVGSFAVRALTASL